jgi:hypothetical protein
MPTKRVDLNDSETPEPATANNEDMNRPRSRDSVDDQWLLGSFSMLTLFSRQIPVLSWTVWFVRVDGSGTCSAIWDRCSIIRFIDERVIRQREECELGNSKFN